LKVKIADERKEGGKSMKKLLVLLLAGLLILIPIGGCTPKEAVPIGVAVEFMDHAACAYIAQDKGWFEDEGLELTAYESYVTGMALVAALARGDIDVAYICLVPAINAYANGKVPLKVVAGTHKYGYGLVVNPDKVKTIADLEKPGIRLGCVREGGAVDVLLHKTVDKYNLDESKILDNIQRMNPPKQALAIRMGQEESGFEMMLMSQDVWPEMQGSVLVVKEDLITNRPEVVRKLVKVSQKATDWGNQHPGEAAEVVAMQLGAVGGSLFPAKAAEVAVQLEITPEVLLRSMDRLDYTTDIDASVVQQTIDYLVELDYIKASFSAGDILDLRFIESE